MLTDNYTDQDYVGMRGNITKIYIKSDDCKAGVEELNTNGFGKQHFCGPTEITDVSIRMKGTKSSSAVIKRRQ